MKDDGGDEMKDKDNRPTPETDAREQATKGLLCGAANLDLARHMERERDEARAERDAALDRCGQIGGLKQRIAELNVQLDHAGAELAEMREWRAAMLETARGRNGDQPSPATPGARCSYEAVRSDVPSDGRALGPKAGQEMASDGKAVEG